MHRARGREEAPGGAGNLTGWCAWQAALECVNTPQSQVAPPASRHVDCRSSGLPALSVLIWAHQFGDLGLVPVLDSTDVHRTLGIILRKFGETE